MMRWYAWEIEAGCEEGPFRLKPACVVRVV
jgi:hypothetical protein